MVDGKYFDPYTKKHYPADYYIIGGGCVDGFSITEHEDVPFLYFRTGNRAGMKEWHEFHNSCVPSAEAYAAFIEHCAKTGKTVYNLFTNEYVTGTLDQLDPPIED